MASLVYLWCASFSFGQQYFTQKTVSFDQDNGGSPYNKAACDRDFGNCTGFVSHSPQTAVSNGQLKIKMPGNQEIKGLIKGTTLPLRNEYFSEMRFKFESGFDWGTKNDMKLPLGLGGGTLPTGGKCDRTNGWTARVTINGSSRKFAVYAYDFDRRTYENNKCYARTLRSEVVAQPNQWYTIRLYVKTNTTNQRNGIVRLWIDGKKVVEQTNILWSSNSKNVSKLLTHMFRGGAGEPPQRDTQVFIDYIKWWYPYQRTVVTDGNYGIQNKSTKRYLWYKNDALTSIPLVYENFLKYSSQRFTLTRLGVSDYAIKHTSTGHFLIVENGQLRVKALSAADLQSNMAYQWFLVKAGNGLVYIRHRPSTNLYLKETSPGQLGVGGGFRQDNSIWRLLETNVPGQPSARAATTGNSLLPTTSIFPNPARHQATVNLMGDGAQVAIQAFSATGQLVYAQSVHSPKGQHAITFNTQNWPAGLYWVSVKQQTHKQPVFMKLMVQH